MLAKGREKSLLRRHPWIFSGGVARMEGKARSGETIDIVDHQGKWLARGAYSPSSQIRARVWTFDRNEAIDSAFFERRLQQAQTWRAWLAERDGLDSYRLDRRRVRWPAGRHYRPLWQLSCCSCSAQAPNTSAPPSSAPCRTCSRTAPFTIAAMSPCVKRDWSWPRAGGGRTAPALLPITEHGMKLLVDIQGGHKTGYYLDQRDSRLATRRYVADKRVLNCFSYTGGFAVSALMGGCRQVTSVDTSQEALDVARQNVEINGLDLSKAEFVRDDVFKLLRKYRDQGEKFDVIVMDPPKFVENKSQLMAPAAAIKISICWRSSC